MKLYGLTIGVEETKVILQENMNMHGVGVKVKNSFSIQKMFYNQEN